MHENSDNAQFFLVDHVGRFYGVMMARAESRNPFIDKMWSTREWFNAIGPAKECMPQDTFIDLY